MRILARMIAQAQVRRSRGEPESCIVPEGSAAGAGARGAATGRATATTDQREPACPGPGAKLT